MDHFGNLWKLWKSLENPVILVYSFNSGVLALGGLQVRDPHLAVLVAERARRHQSLRLP